MTNLYIISCDLGVKVGLSNNPEKRIKQLQTGNHLKLKLEKYWEVPKELSRKIETLAHHKLRHSYAKRGEWFIKCSVFDAELTIAEAYEKIIGEPLS
jgi:hypothetical protein